MEVSPLRTASINAHAPPFRRWRLAVRVKARGALGQRHGLDLDAAVCRVAAFDHQLVDAVGWRVE